MNKYLLSIDPGLSAGISLFEYDNKGESTLLVNRNIVATGDLLSERFRPLINLVRTLTREYPFEYKIVIEKSFYPGIANQMHLKLLGMFEYVFGSDKIEYISPMTVKKSIGVCNKRRPVDVKPQIWKHQLKAQVKAQVQALLKGKEKERVLWESEDAVDSVAIGLAYIIKGIEL